jgi:hypothetical protein
VGQLGVNAHGEVLEPGRVADCYLGLLLPPGPAGELEAGTVLADSVDRSTFGTGSGVSGVAQRLHPLSVCRNAFGDSSRVFGPL